MSALSLLLLVAGALLAVPGAVFCGEVAAAILLGRRPRPATAPASVRARLAVVVPAHDEERHLAATLRSVRAQLREGDRLVVVADNCTDRTASVAAGEGAEVVVRVDAAKRGKGYALEAGIRFLERAPPEIVVFVDADCRLDLGTLDALATTAGATGRPVQACYLILAGEQAGMGGRRDMTAAAFAQVVKNRIRPRGLHALGLPCQLAGSGMAFPWPLIAASDLASGETVEDLKLGLACAVAGHAPIHCAEALVISEFPASRQGATLQRRRWQQGHLHLMAGAVAPLLAGLVRRDRHLVALVLDLMVPPLTLLLAANVILAGLGAGLVMAGGSGLPLALGLASLTGVTGAIATAWVSERKSLGPTRPAALLSHLVSGLALAPRLLSSRPKAWIRTERGDGP